MLSYHIYVYFYSFYFAATILSVYRAFAFKLFASDGEWTHGSRPQHLMIWRSDERSAASLFLRGVVQLFLHHSQGDFVRGQEILHGYQFAWHPARHLRIVLRPDWIPAYKLRPLLRIIYSRHRGLPSWQIRRCYVLITILQLVYHIIQALLYYDRRNVQQGIYAATSHHQKNEVYESIPA